MKPSIKKSVAAAALALTASSTMTADACDRGGRISIGRSYGYSVPQPTYRHYAPPTYAQPSYGQPSYHQNQPVYSQPQPGFSQPVPRTANLGRPVSPQRVTQQPMSRQPAFSQPTAQAQVPQQVTPQRVSPQSQAVAPQQRISQAPARQAAAPQRTAPPTAAPPTAAQNNAAQPNAAQPNAAQPNAAQPNAAQNNAAQPNAATSALQLLASMNTTATTQPVSVPTSPPATAAQNTNQIPEFNPPSASAAGHVGTWSVKLPGSQSVQLTLNDNRSFTWTATKQGKSSSFAGQYRMESGRLTLVRSSDLQQMAGSWTGQDASFTFKLDGATNSGLVFSRS